MALLEFENVTMDYGNDVEVISNLSFKVEKGEIFTLLGPSGCGKSTILRMVAGLETPTKGSIKIDGLTVFDKKVNLTPEKRNIGLVFQDYALFPHLTVYENIVFGLHGQKKKFKKERAKELLEIVNLVGYDKRYPHELSGGQQQRVALARALAKEPALLLMDEPFSNLDTSLREKMRLDIYDIIKKTGTTAIFVTHDQGEALALSDKIAFLDSGKMSQVGTPHELYWKPTCKDTASFMGKATLIDANFDENGVDDVFGMSLSENSYKACKGTLCIRPELVSVSNTGSYKGVVEHTSFVGSHREVIVKYHSDDSELLITAIAEPFVQIERDSEINFDIDAKGLIVWEKN